MAYRRITDGNIVLDSFGRREMVIATHGGYTPARNLLQRGSGTTTVPNSVVQICFYSEHNVATVGNAVAQLAIDAVKQENIRQKAFVDANLPVPRDPNYQGAVILTPVETKFSGNVITNYSLSHNGKYDSLESSIQQDLLQMDVLRIRPGAKAHLSDVWTFMSKHSLRYDIVHFGACRVNKLSTAQDVVGAPIR